MTQHSYSLDGTGHGDNAELVVWECGTCGKSTGRFATLEDVSAHIRLAHGKGTAYPRVRWWHDEMKILSLMAQEMGLDLQQLGEAKTLELLGFQAVHVAALPKLAGEPQLPDLMSSRKMEGKLTPSRKVKPKLTAQDVIAAVDMVVANVDLRGYRYERRRIGDVTNYIFWREGEDLEMGRVAFGPGVGGYQFTLHATAKTRAADNPDSSEDEMQRHGEFITIWRRIDQAVKQKQWSIEAYFEVQEALETRRSMQDAGPTPAPDAETGAGGDELRQPTESREGSFDAPDVTAQARPVQTHTIRSGHLSSAPAPVQAVDFVLVTALAEERDAVLDKLSEYQQLPPSEGDIRIYYQSELPVTA